MDSEGIYAHLQKSRNEIRLLVLDPAKGEDVPIVGHLNTISLDGEPEYVALSYCWGDPAVTEPIQIGEKTLKVTTNLALALRKLRSLYPQRQFWIDAISINQASLQERNIEVLRMGAIYSQAAFVIAWLGPGNQPIKMDGEDMRMNLELGITLLSDLIQITDVEDESQLAAFPKVRECWSWESLQAILDRDYWKRIWILQELVLARDVEFLIGDRSISINDMARGMMTAWKLRDSSFVGRERGGFTWYLIDSMQWSGCLIPMQMIQELSENDNEAFHLDDLLMRTFHKLATDPRDKIYGLLGLVGHDITPDYSQPVEKLFWDVGRQFIVEEARLHLLLYGGVGWGERSTEMPTWVPDWTVEEKHKYFEERFHTDASKNRAAAIEIHLNTAVLRVQGTACGALVGSKQLSSKARFNEQCWFEYFELWRNGDNLQYGATILPNILSTIFVGINPIDGKPIIKSEDSFYQLLDVFLFNEPPPLASDTLYRNHEDHFPAWKAWLGDQVEDSQDIKTKMAETVLGDVEVDRLEHFCETVKSHDFTDHHTFAFNIARMETYNLHFFWTETGYCGLGPPGTKKSDVVCILFGCHFPVLLRREESSFVLVGPCFVPGLMDGEAIEAVQQGQRNEEWFNII